MLRLPDKGISRSIARHNVRLDSLTDWLEGSLLFSETEISVTDVIDLLIEELIYEDQDFAAEVVSDVWAEMQRRQQWISAHGPFQIQKRRITRVKHWQDVAGDSFCILLSLAHRYSNWSTELGQGYVEQGELFEKLTKESLQQQFPGWTIYQTGWTRSNTTQLAEVVRHLTELLGETPGKIELWDEPRAKEKGLDLLCYRPFTDNRVAVPVYLIQCASGGRWEHKRKTPDLEIWRSVIQFTVMPKRGFAIPFALSDKDFEQSATIIDGLLVDRCRLLAAAQAEQEWLSYQLKDQLINWLEPRIVTLPYHS